MPVAAIGEYEFAPRDHAGLYGDNQIVYFCWEGHLLFAAPFITFVPRGVMLGQYLNDTIRPLLGPDPDAVALDWAMAQWSNGPAPFTPDFDATITDNGIGHKDKIIMRTPGLCTLMPDS